MKPPGESNANGQVVTGAEWQAWRKQLLAYRLHPYLRISQSIDPAWDPVKSRVKNLISAESTCLVFRAMGLPIPNCVPA